MLKTNFVWLILFVDQYPAACESVCRCYAKPHEKALVAKCSHPDLTQIPKSLPKDTDWLILNGNIISSPEAKEIEHLQSLSRLDLRNNNIEIISEAFVEYLDKHENLADLDISNNNLQTIPKNFAKPNITKMSMSGNRFRCSCNNLWMKNWLIKKREMIQDYTTVSCQLESGRHIPFVQLTDDDLTCPSMLIHNNKIARKYYCLSISFFFFFYLFPLLFNISLIQMNFPVGTNADVTQILTPEH